MSGMGGGHTQLRDRMWREAIVEVLRRPVDAPATERFSRSSTPGCSDRSRSGDRVRIELAVPPKRSPLTDALTSEVERRVQALPEVTVTEIVAATAIDKQTSTRKARGTDG